MVASVIYRNLHIHHGVSKKDPVLHCFLNSLFNGSYKLSRNCSSFNCINKFKSFSSWLWLNPQETVSVLPSSSGLFYVFSLTCCYFLNRFFIGNLLVSFNCNYSKL